MALITRTTSPAGDPIAGLLAADAIPIDTPAARRALQAGALEARRAALATAETLLRLGNPLLAAILCVSFVHIFHTVAAIKPGSVAALHLPDWLYHLTAAALTVAIDAVALYGIAAGGATRLAGLSPARSWGVAFFLLTTFLLNATFVVRYAPSLTAELRGTILPALDLLFGILLPAAIPVGLATVERTMARLQAAHLRLTVEVTAIEELLRPVAKKPQNASERILGECADRGFGGNADGPAGAVSGGRPASFTLDTVLAAGEGAGVIRRADLIQQLGCSETTLDRLLAEGLARGAIARAGRGAYRVLRGEA
ncbi:MAG: hypothetical protein RLZZ387_2451 [Chloroflexota bacterium]|jgi:hypothetical protein